MIIAAFLLGAPSLSPSFDCAGAGTPVERSICADPDLAIRDRALALLYTSSGKPFVFPAAYVRAQRQWLSRRDRCTTSECIRRVYDERIAVLTGSAPSAERFQHSNYVATLSLTPIMQDWQAFYLGMAVQAGNGNASIISAAGLVHTSDGAGRWVSDGGCVLDFRKAGSTWQLRQSASCGRLLRGQCFGGTYYNSEDWLNPARPDERAICE